MGPNGSTCKERRELEKLIHDRVSSIAQCSRTTAKLATETGQDTQLSFEMAKAEYAAEMIRLETLRECLTVHERLHGCRPQLTTTFEAAQE